MSTNFGDADFEPSDEQLAELMNEAFADIKQTNARMLSRLSEDIERSRERSLSYLSKLVEKYSPKAEP